MPPESTSISPDIIKNFVDSKAAILLNDLPSRAEDSGQQKSEGLDNSEKSTLERLRERIFLRVFRFYKLANENGDPETLLQIAEEVAQFMELETLMQLQEQLVAGSIKRIFMLYPLRGALALKLDAGNSPIEQFIKENELDLEVVHIPVGMARNGKDKTQADFYAGDDFALSIGGDGDVVIIKDFGIATGGTVKKLLMMLEGKNLNGVVVQGAVCTGYAKKRLKRVRAGLIFVNVVEGQMPVEVHENYNGSDEFYITALGKPNIGKFESVGPVDWGDKMFGKVVEWQEADLQKFLERIEKKFGNLSDEEIRSLKRHYREKMKEEQMVEP